MNTHLLLVAGTGVVLGIVAFYLHKKMGNAVPLVDDELVTEELQVESLKGWHYKYRQEHKCQSLLLAYNATNEKYFKLLRVKEADYQKVLIQALYSEQEQKIIRLRLIHYGKLGAALTEKLEKMAGVMLVEED